jgi:hypothetical protein
MHSPSSSLKGVAEIENKGHWDITECEATICHNIAIIFWCLYRKFTTLYLLAFRFIYGVLSNEMLQCRLVELIDSE